MFNWNDLRCKGRETGAGRGKVRVKCGLSLCYLQINKKSARTTYVVRAVV